MTEYLERFVKSVEQIAVEMRRGNDLREEHVRFILDRQVVTAAQVPGTQGPHMGAEDQERLALKAELTALTVPFKDKMRTDTLKKLLAECKAANAVAAGGNGLCVACQGKGKNSKGETCPICQGAAPAAPPVAEPPPPVVPLAPVVPATVKPVEEKPAEPLPTTTESAVGKVVFEPPAAVVPSEQDVRDAVIALAAKIGPDGAKKVVTDKKYGNAVMVSMIQPELRQVVIDRCRELMK